MAPEDLLTAVERSPAAAAAHDRAGWVGLFTDDARVEDPVGSAAHVGLAEIGRFYDTFIGPRDIVFHRDLDVVRDRVVVRDLELEVGMGWGVTMNVPAFLRYDLREVDGEWKIAALRAYWELPSMVLQFLRSGPGAAPAAMKLAQGLLRNQGPRGTAGFAAGFRRAGSRHKKRVDAFLSAAARGDLHTLSSSATIALGDDDPLDVAELSGARWSKMIGAGSTVAVSITSDHGRGVMFADVARRGNEITQVRYFPG